MSVLKLFQCYLIFRSMFSQIILNTSSDIRNFLLFLDTFQLFNCVMNNTITILTF